MNNEIEKNNYSIGVVTYVDRYESYFKPLIKQLAEVFPDKEIVCIINGHPDKLLQVQYLKAVTKFLSSFKNVRYMAFEDHQPLAKCWNWIMLMSYSERALILNDDLKLDLYFRNNFENHLNDHPDFFVINGSWSNFLISKKIIEKVGWFEERLLGCGDEDGDYMFRMVEKNIELVNCFSHGIINYVAPQNNAGWQKFSDVSSKRAKYNEEFMKQKWYMNSVDGEDKKYDIRFVWNGAETAGSLKEGMATPDFYSKICLEDGLFGKKDLSFDYENKKINFKTKLKLLVYIPYSLLRKNIGKLVRKIKK